MHGGPSHVDTFDYKPLLARDDGKELPFALPPNIDAVPKLLNGPGNSSNTASPDYGSATCCPTWPQQADSICASFAACTRVASRTGRRSG